MLRELEAADAEVEPARVATHLTFVFVGAGYAGVEALAELADLVADALRWYPRLQGFPQRWVLVDAAPKILPEIPPRLGDYAARELTRRGVEIHVGTTLDSLTASEATLSGGLAIPTHTVVWTAGVRANPLMGELGLPLDDRGRVRVDPLLRVEGRERIWALGDSAAVPNGATPDRVDPPTSQHALRQARRLAKNLSGDPQPYAYRMLGQVATLGRYKGIADVMGIRLRGFPGWFVTRSYHLYQLPLLSRKLRVVVDWTTSLFFRRDIAELSGLGHPHRLRVNVEALYDLRLRTPRLELRLPTGAELEALYEVAAAGIHPPEVMPFGVAWTDDLTRDGFLAYHGDMRQSWAPESWNIDLGVWAGDVLVGVQGIRATGFAESRTVGTGSWLGARHQGHGIGTEMRAAVIELAFRHLGAEAVTSGAFETNVASRRVSEKLGYRVVGHETMSPRGTPEPHVVLRLERTDWPGAPFPVVVEGVEACLPLFRAG